MAEWHDWFILWYLAQQGYSSALFVPLSEHINKSRKGYYDAYTLVEENARHQRRFGCDPVPGLLLLKMYTTS